jgi:hypothetical protein
MPRNFTIDRQLCASYQPLVAFITGGIFPVIKPPSYIRAPSSPRRAVAMPAIGKAGTEVLSAAACSSVQSGIGIMFNTPVSRATFCTPIRTQVYVPAISTHRGSLACWRSPPPSRGPSSSGNDFKLRPPGLGLVRERETEPVRNVVPI